MIVYDLKTNHIVNPLGFALPQISLSYKVKDAVGKRQLAAQIRIYNPAGRIVHDSGARVDIDSLSYVPAFKPAPRTRYTWDVCVCSDAYECVTSERAWFETGKMNEPWKAQWITPDKKHVNTRMFRNFHVKGPVKKARLYMSGLGLYEAEINGKRVSDECLAPLCNNYEAWVQ